ncbi:hypothetical protein [Pseudothermotoga lettingae]|jgi:molybdopterin converting factor small subunit|uniref:MoaD family protein n=1 Tax=Pseudothermotoga lettingae (strain ATCC BAA-301 / DSM 14385 / NBRC 107922 / TMO) TaxID=416591 RepID=A8F413_PSELT|nr:hypothetical protein [Pseudothermotoga lettingae]ABV32897.1 hypothetical protein Tlet_0329 [Pseudothermotoga lettingae TMO]GLI48104.1 hypothetical protein PLETTINGATMO_02730 [Pseudothermotoga lettingae TMO]
MKIRFGNMVDNLVGIKEIEVCGRSLDEIFKNLSSSLKKNVNLLIDEKRESVYLVVENDGKFLKNWVIALHNGVNLLDIDRDALQDGELVIFVPVSGG